MRQIERENKILLRKILAQRKNSNVRRSLTGTYDVVSGEIIIFDFEQMIIITLNLSFLIHCSPSQAHVFQVQLSIVGNNKNELISTIKF